MNNKKESLQEFSTVSHIKNTMDVERFLLAHSLIQDFPGFIFIFFIQQFSSEIKRWLYKSTFACSFCIFNSCINTGYFYTPNVF